MSLQHCILGLLEYEPMTGYDMKFFMDTSITHFWTAQLSQIYRELIALEKKGHVIHHIEPQEGRPDRKVFQITAEGQSAFRKWLLQFPDSLSPTIRDEFSVKIFFGSMLNPGEIRFQLRRYIKERENELKYLLYVEKVVHHYSKKLERPQEVFFWNMLLKRNRIIASSQIDWAKEFLGEMELIG